MQTILSRRFTAQSRLFLRNFLFILCVILLAACAPSQPTLPPTFILPPQNPTAPAPSFPGSVRAAFIEEHNLYIWDSATGDASMIFNPGDITDVKISDDGQMVAIVRLINMDAASGVGQSALWVINHDSQNAHELVSADTLRQRLDPSPTDSTGIAEMEWIPGTLRVIYSGTKGNAAATEIRQAEDVYVVDADTGTDTLMAPAGNGLRVSGTADGLQFIPSPDGTEIALLTSEELSFVNADGSNLRQAVFTFPGSGAGDMPFVMTGVWTQGSRAFLVNAPVDSDPNRGVNFSVTRVPLDGSPADVIANITNSVPMSLSFSPDGKHIAYRTEKDSRLIWAIMPLNVDVGPLAIPTDYTFNTLNLHWSPAGEAYVSNPGELSRLCPDAENTTNLCGDIVQATGEISDIRWIDGSRFLYLTRDPAGLFLGNIDGTNESIARLSSEEYLHPLSVALTGYHP